MIALDKAVSRAFCYARSQGLGRGGIVSSSCKCQDGISCSSSSIRIPARRRNRWRLLSAPRLQSRSSSLPMQQLLPKDIAYLLSFMLPLPNCHENDFSTSRNHSWTEYVAGVVDEQGLRGGVQNQNDASLAFKWGKDPDLLPGGNGGETRAEPYYRECSYNSKICLRRLVLLLFPGRTLSTGPVHPHGLISQNSNRHDSKKALSLI